MYSTIEEAWSKPSIIEGFKTEEECMKDCENLISQIVKCDGCVQRMKEVLGQEWKPAWLKHLQDPQTLQYSLIGIIVLLIFIVALS